MGWPLQKVKNEIHRARLQIPRTCPPLPAEAQMNCPGREALDARLESLRQSAPPRSRRMQHSATPVAEGSAGCAARMRSRACAGAHHSESTHCRSAAQRWTAARLGFAVEHVHDLLELWILQAHFVATLHNDGTPIRVESNEAVFRVVQLRLPMGPTSLVSTVTKVPFSIRDSSIAANICPWLLVILPRRRWISTPAL